MNYETAEERGVLTIPAPKFALGQQVRLTGSICSASVAFRNYGLDERVWYYGLLRHIDYALCNPVPEHCLESAD